MNLIIIGAGGYGQTVADVAQQLGRYEKIVFLDDNKVSDDVVGKCSDFEKFIADDTEIYPAFGNNEVRMSFLEKLEKAGANLPTIIHKTAFVSPRATVEKGSVVLPMAVVNTDVVVKKGCIINCGCVIDHGCVIENGTHICIGALVKAENRIPAFMKVEAGQVIENRTYKL